MSVAQQQTRAAALVAASIGAVLVAASAPFTIELWDDRVAWEAVWSQAPGGPPVDVEMSGTPSEARAVVNVTDAIPASVEVVLACSDGAAPGEQPAQVTLRLVAEGEEVAAASGTCAELSAQPWNVTVRDPPPIDGTKELDEETAQADLDERAAAHAGDFAFEIVANAARPQALPLPLPLQGTFQATLTVKANVWAVDAVEPPEEVLR